jgi:hypothetical protein
MTTLLVLLSVGLYVFERPAAAEYVAMIAIPVAIIEGAITIRNAMTRRA